MAGASGKKLDDTYKLAWLRGLKTTYYLRTTSATQAEKSTGRTGQLNAVSANGHDATMMAPVSAALASSEVTEPATDIKFCAIDDPGCEACQ
jgi:ribonucleoside-diphosphate reductase alpha chain